MYRKKVATRRKVARKSSEYDEQCKVFEWAYYNRIKYPHLTLLHSSLNGVKLGIGQAVKAKRSGMLKGIPDINLPFACMEFTQLYIEMKVGKNKLTNEQVDLQEKLVQGGAFYSVAYSANEAIEIIKKYVALCKPMKVSDGIT